jgi:type III secretion protein Q
MHAVSFLWSGFESGEVLLSTIRPYSYRRLSRSQVDLCNPLFKRDPGLSFQMGADAYTLRVHAGGGGLRSPGALVARVSVDDRIGFELVPEDTLLTMMLGETLSADEFATLPQAVRGIALEAALENLLDRIDRFSGGRSTIARVSENQPFCSSSETIGFYLIRHKDGCLGRGVLSTDTDSLQWLVARWGRLPGKRRRSVDHLPVTWSIEVGRVDLAASRVRALACLDIILANGTGALHEREIRLVNGHDLALTGKAVQPGRFKVENIMKGGKDTMKKTSAPSDKSPAATLATADIPVSLVFEIGQIQITIGELQHLQAGYTFSLTESIDMDRPVTIKANGVAIGKGEMVMIDDRLGVRIHEFMDNHQGECES